MEPVERVWWRDFANAHDKIPPAWLVHLDDGFVGIDPVYRDEPVARLYGELVRVGYARGWMP